MNNYIIWNGVGSGDLQGLMVCELPPISRPKMRTQITEIEGKDGDISDNIGYSAYDKTIKIALTKDFDINKIINYFTGSGEITFSNEPDKFYNAEILEQIDFERLIKFRTANVKFHTQPFKYLIDEDSVELEIDSETELLVVNQGLVNSRPIITIFGEGIIEIAINGYAQFQITIPENEDEITIDSMLQEAYLVTPNNLRNRSMVGEFPTLQPGQNIITWTGNLTRIKIHPKSRWF